MECTNVAGIFSKVYNGEIREHKVGKICIQAWQKSSIRRTITGGRYYID